MIRWLTSLLAAAVPMLAATGDVLNGAVLDNGWMVVLRIEGGATNGTFSFGFSNATNNTFNGGEKFRLSVNSPGYDATGATNVWRGNFYGTKQIRWAYPDNAYPRTLMDGSDVLIYIAIDNFVCNEDTGMSASIGGGLYTFGGTPNNAATITLTNWSAQPYPKVIANWSDVFYQQMTNTSYRVRATAWHAAAHRGKPVAAVSFFAKDESGDTVSSTVNAMAIDRDYGDLIPTGEYFTDLDLSSLTHSNLVRFDFAAYPHRGNSSAVLDTRTDPFNSWPTFLPRSRTNFYFTNNYSAIAVVGPTGSDANGRATNIVDPTLVNSAHYFATINGAMAAIKGTNNSLFGHNDCGGAKVYVRNAIVNWTGGTASTAGTPIVWAEVINYPGDIVSLTTRANNQDISDRVKLQGIDLAFSAAQVPFNNIECLWFDRCTGNNDSSAPIQNTTSTGEVYWTRNTIHLWNASIPHLSHNQTSPLFRANQLDRITAACIWYNAIGNRRIPTVATGGFIWVDENSTITVPMRDAQICYNNYLMGITNVSGANIGSQSGNVYGKAFPQNVLEFTHTGGSSFGISASTTLNHTNWFLEGVVSEGGRNQFFYGELGSTGAVKNLNTVRNSIFIALGEATDIGGTGNAGRTNDWSMRWRVGGRGIINQMITASPTLQHGDPEFNGRNSFRPPNGSFSPTTWPKFVDADGYYRGGTGDGNGNYRLRSDSPILHSDYAVDHEFAVPFDMDGMPRGRFDPPGAFVAGNVRRGAFF